VRYTQTGSAVANFSLATSEQWNDRDGKKQERTEWHNIVVWGKQAEHCGQYLSKGRQVFIEGSIRTRSYDDKTGNKRYITEIVAQRIQFLGGGGGTRLPQQGMESGSVVDDMAMGGMGGGQPPLDDDIPF
jgi:single-strand DNA-binding protein